MMLCIQCTYHGIKNVIVIEDLVIYEDRVQMRYKKKKKKKRKLV